MRKLGNAFWIETPCLLTSSGRSWTALWTRFCTLIKAMSGSVPTANVRAIVDTTCYEVASAGLDDALRSRPLINLARQLSEKLLRAEREMRFLGE